MSSTPDETRSAAAGGREDRRRRVIIDGEHWVVREIDAPTFDRRGGRHLIFECSSLFRRVRVFPENWYDLDDETLFSLNPNVRSD